MIDYKHKKPSDDDEWRKGWKLTFLIILGIIVAVLLYAFLLAGAYLGETLKAM
jgi:hypothetical protein